MHAKIKANMCKRLRILTYILTCPVSMDSLAILKDINDMLFNLMIPSKIHLLVPRKPWPLHFSAGQAH